MADLVLTRLNGIQNVPLSMPPDQAAVRTDLQVCNDLLQGAKDKKIILLFGSPAKQISPGQLKSEAGDPARFADFLRANGLTLADFNQIIDDTLQNPSSTGGTLNLTPGSETCQKYGVGNAADCVTTHLRPANAASTEAQGHKDLGTALKLESSKEDVSNPGFFRALGDAFVEFFALIGRGFGSDWNPETITFNKDHIEAHFRGVGADLVTKQGPAMQAMLSTTQGKNEMRSQLLSHRPPNVGEDIWPKLVEQVITGASEQIAKQNAKLPPDLSPAEQTAVLDYLREHDFSPEANAKISSVYTFPDAGLRKEALLSLPRSPENEANNMFALFHAPDGVRPLDGPEAREWALQTAMHSDIGADGRKAIFDTLRQAGFRASPGSLEVKCLTNAVLEGGGIEPASLRDRYMRELPHLGLSRMAMAGEGSYSLPKQLKQIKANEGEEAANQFMANLEKNNNSTSNLRYIIARSEGFIRIYDPNVKALSKEQGALVVSVFEGRKIELKATTIGVDAHDVVISAHGPAGPNTIDLSKYVKDPVYARDTLKSLGMGKEAFDSLLFNTAQSVKFAPENVTARRGEINARLSVIGEDIDKPGISAETRAELSAERERLIVEGGGLQALREGTGLLTIDIRPSSATYKQFALDITKKPADPLLLMASSVLVGPGSVQFFVKLTDPGAKVSSTEFAQMLKQPDAEAQFKAKYPKLDFRDTVLAFAYIANAPGGGVKVAGTEINLASSVEIKYKVLGDKIRDKKDGNLSDKLPPFLQAAFGGNVNIAPDDPNYMIDNAPVSVFSPVDRFQYSHGGNAGATESAETRASAKKYMAASGGKKEPANVFRALFDMDNHVDKGSTWENGQVVGDQSAFVGLKPEQVHVISMNGDDAKASMRASFRSDSKIIKSTFEDFGGVKDVTIVDPNPTGEDAYGALEAKILSTPAGEAVVFAYSGHGAKDGLVFKGKWLSSADLKRLMETAARRGVAFMVISSACHSGERVQVARERMLDKLETAGQLPPQIRQLDNLRAGTIDFQEGFGSLAAIPAASRTPGFPTPDQISALAAKALKDGPGSKAAQDLKALSDKASAERNNFFNTYNAVPDGTPAQVKAKSKAAQQVNYLDGIISMHRGLDRIQTAKTDLAASQPPLPSGILNNKVLTGVTAIRAGDSFTMNNLGPLSDVITGTMQQWMPQNIDFGAGADAGFIADHKP